MTELYKVAVGAAKNAYAPYSGFTVGAAVLCDDGTVFTGCNVENASYSVTLCAERVALFSAVAAGHRSFKAIAVAGSVDGDYSKPIPPCGICLQAMSEFFDGDTVVVLSDGNGGVREYKFVDLLPMGFKATDMGV